MSDTTREPLPRYYKAKDGTEWELVKTRQGLLYRPQGAGDTPDETWLPTLYIINDRAGTAPLPRR